MTYTEQAQPLLYSVIDMDGNTWTQAETAAYNDLTNKINTSANRPIESGSLVEQEREFYLDQRHRLHVNTMQAYRTL